MSYVGVSVSVVNRLVSSGQLKDFETFEQSIKALEIQAYLRLK